jgi:tetratricopeptide (TPR) repeat protein
MLLLAISGQAIGAARRRPYFLVGWFWFLGVLVPFIGLLQAGEQAMADRFAYVPLIGLFLLLVWGTEELTHCWRNQRLVLSAAAVAVLVCCAALSRRQTGYWQNSVTLFSHALAVTDNNARARSNLGIALAAEGKTKESMQQLLEALRLNPEHAVAHGAVGLCREQQGRFDEAIQEYETALRLKPDFPEALNNLAWLKATNPDPKYRDGTAAVELAERACRLTEQQEPLFIGTLAAAYAEAGRFEDAVETAERAKSLATAEGEKELAKKNQQLLELYRAAKPYHEAERSRN